MISHCELNLSFYFREYLLRSSKANERDVAFPEIEDDLQILGSVSQFIELNEIELFKHLLQADVVSVDWMVVLIRHIRLLSLWMHQHALVFLITDLSVFAASF